MLRVLWFLFLRGIGFDPRCTFLYWNGRKMVGVDPIPAARVLLTHKEFSWETTPLLTEDDDPVVQTDAIRVAACAAREAFGILPYERGGLTEAECCQVLWAFAEYLSSLKKNGSGPLTSPVPTEPRPSGESPMNAESASGSTGTGSVCSDPGRSPLDARPGEMTG